jgi:hypothetical protein
MYMSFPFDLMGKLIPEIISDRKRKYEIILGM